MVAPCGPESTRALSSDGYAVHFVAEAYRHAKPVAAFGAGIDLLGAAPVEAQPADGDSVVVEQGIVTTTRAVADLPDDFTEAFAALIAGHRVRTRETSGIPA